MRNLVFRFSCSVVALLFIACVPSIGTPQDLPGMAIGLREFKETGKYPKVIELPAGRQSIEFILPLPAQRGNRALGTVKFDHPIKPFVYLRIRAKLEDAFPLDSALSTGGTGYQFLFTGRCIVPLYGHLYLVSFSSPTAAVLRRVTDEVPKELRPAKNSRTIALNAYHSTIFWAQSSINRHRQEAEQVSVIEISKTGQAKIDLIPGMTNGPDITNRKPLRLTVQKGGLLTARGRSYRVTNVVPAQTIANFGHLVGWIELTDLPADDKAPQDKKPPVESQSND